jgi:diaminopimelate epimerase
VKFSKYHALGNDYIVIEPSEFGELTNEKIRRICHRNYGIGSDGILYGPISTSQADFALRIFNPDGSEAEKSGNGLRIFARYLFDKAKVSKRDFSLLTKGGIVQATIGTDGRHVSIQMGKVSFNSQDIPVAGNSREVIQEEMRIGQEILHFTAVTIGNPHCVILRDDISEKLARTIGPLVENEPRFVNRTNVQFMKVLDRANIKIEIWERGAGYTLASGSSSCAAAATARKLNLCDSQIRVHMPGGVIDITIFDDFSVKMTGPVTQVAEGDIFEEIFEGIS